MRTFIGIRCALFLVALTGLCPLLPAREVPNFNLPDTHEKNHELYRAKGKVVVLFFTGTGCPVARKSVGKLKVLEEDFRLEGVDFWIVNSYAGESMDDIRREVVDLELENMIYLLDSNQSVALSYGVDRTAAVIAIDTVTWEVFYQGALDDQIGEGAEKPKAMQPFLRDALIQFLAGEPIARPRTRSIGCRIPYAKVSEDSDAPDYAMQVAPVLRNKCVKCHRSGGIGPWSMSSHRRVAQYSEMIEEVLLTHRMPPWGPHPGHGEFLDDPSLTREEIQTLIRWIQAGSPGSGDEDPLRSPLPALDEWRLGKPDEILRLPEVQTIAATGVEPYRHLEVKNPFEREVWIRAIEIKPGNHRVVHHVILFARWPGGPEGDVDRGVFFSGWGPGANPLKYPEGVAKRLPTDATLTVEMHYTTTGSEQTDLTEIAFFLADGPQDRIGETRAAINWDLDIPPGQEDARHMATYAFKKPATIYGLFPHMHFRGKWMRYELLLPDGNRETLLHVPRYDFQWQLSYYLKHPRPVPAGSWLVVTGSFDNSEHNPANPDPSQRVFYGPQSTDEMFIGYFEAADDAEMPPELSR